jgi:preprotein translocase subunit SecY
MPIPTSIRNLKAAFLIGDLRNKILFTLFIIAVYRLGDNIICPGVDFNAVQSLAAAANKGGVIAYLNLFSGGALTKMAVFGLGIMPYITSSIIIQLLMVVIPKFEQWREEGPSGQRKLTQVTRYMTIALAIMQSTGLAYAFHNGGGGLLGSSVPLNVDLIPDFTVPRVLLVVLTMTAGTVVVMWLAELITQRGVGQGMSVLIFTNVIAGLPTQGDALLKSAGWPKFTFLLLLALTFLVMIVFIEQCQRRIPVTFAKRVVGRRMYGGQSTYIPMKLNTGGVVPIIFAASVLYFPLLISNVFPSTGWGKDVQTWISTHLAQPGNLVYAGITFDPHQQADVIRKQGGYIPGIRPGYPTERHLQNILYRITLPGALFLALVALLPSIFLALWNIQNYPFAGTTLLIAVGVALETMKQVDSQLMLRNYEGFLR